MSDSPTDPFSRSMMDDSSSPNAPRDDRRPQQVGPYRIIELIGEGGMGEVYKAERRTPIVQTVAIKIVKLGLDSREVISRFDAERQSLALMDHPAIAKVFDAGTTDTGRPYFVMEYVAGKPITTFCDDNRLSIGDRLKLFMTVCDAIAHAHGKAIIHRDIKPSNVLAFMHDGAPAVKVIDFGIAKAIGGASVTDQTFFTARGQAIGTYDSMSPEQAEGSPDIDTRTDVYSLGVLLYELLTGAKPFDHATLARAADAEIKRIIREVDPPRPSTRLSSLGLDATKFADKRQAKLDALAKQLRSELEWIPLKAMRKERMRRYASPLQLKEDIENYVAGKPLIAGPETRSYRVKKFVRRNRTGVATSVAMLLLLVLGTSLYIRNIRAEQRKTQLALVETEKQRAEAQKQAKIAIDSSNFLASIFRNADPTRSLGRDITVVELLNQAIEKMDNGWLTPEPITEAVVRYVVGTTFNSLGRYDDAVKQLRRARELDAQHRVANDPQNPITLSDLALVLTNQGKFDEAEPLYRESLRLERGAVPPDDPIIAKSLVSIGALQRGQQKFAESEQTLRDAIAMYRKSLPADDTDVLMATNNLAALLWNQGRLAEAEPLCREVLRLRKAKLPANHPYVAQSIHNLAALLRDQKKFDEAEPLAREAIALRRKILPPKHPDTATALNTLAGVLNGQQKYADAEPFCRECLDIRRSALPAGHHLIASAADELAWLLYKQGKFEDAIPLWQEALQIRTAILGKTHDATRKTAGRLEAMLDRLKRPDESRAIRTEYGLLEPTTQPATQPTTTTRATQPTSNPAR